MCNVLTLHFHPSFYPDSFETKLEYIFLLRLCHSHLIYTLLQSQNNLCRNLGDNELSIFSLSFDCELSLTYIYSNIIFLNIIKSIPLPIDPRQRLDNLSRIRIDIFGYNLIIKGVLQTLLNVMVNLQFQKGSKENKSCKNKMNTYFKGTETKLQLRK